MTITTPVTLVIPNHPDYDAYIAQRWSVGVALGGSIVTANGLATMTITNRNAGLISYQDIDALVAAGGSVEGMPGFLEISAGSIDNAVAAGLPNRDTADESGNPIVKTWREWRGSNHDLREAADGNFWLGTNASGSVLNGAETVIAHEAYGVNFRTVAEYQAAFPPVDP